MKITVRLKDIEIICDDGGSSELIKYESHNKEVQKTIKCMTDECIRLHKEKSS